MKNKKVNGYSFEKQYRRRGFRQAAARDRLAAYRALSTEEKIAQCRTRPGGSKRELARLGAA
jgi:hypothetical protein